MIPEPEPHVSSQAQVYVQSVMAEKSKKSALSKVRACPLYLYSFVSVVGAFAFGASKVVQSSSFCVTVNVLSKVFAL